MTIVMPDPHPGRCRNHRTEGLYTVRCLDYEAVPHRCTFPPFPVSKQGDGWGGVYTTSRDLTPKKWVKPGTADRTGEGS